MPCLNHGFLLQLIFSPLKVQQRRYLISVHVLQSEGERGCNASESGISSGSGGISGLWECSFVEQKDPVAGERKILPSRRPSSKHPQEGLENMGHWRGIN